MCILKCENLSIGYGKNVLHENISFEINAGDYVCVLGENGSGKTTLIKTLLGLIKPMSGTLKLDKDIQSSGIGYLPQINAAQKNFPTTVWEIVLSGRQNKIKLFYKKEDREEAVKTMKTLDILDLKNKSFQDLSGGQQQRVLLARALCVSDKLLILDEPITGLDIKNQELLYSLIADINKRGTTIIMISHDSNVLATSATHVLSVGHEEIRLLRKEDYLKAEVK